MPRVGGAYAYAREVWGDFSGFVVGWALWLAEPSFAPRRNSWRLLGWAVISIAFTAILCGLWPPAGWLRHN